MSELPEKIGDYYAVTLESSYVAGTLSPEEIIFFETYLTEHGYGKHLVKLRGARQEFQAYYTPEVIAKTEERFLGTLCQRLRQQNN